MPEGRISEAEYFNKNPDLKPAEDKNATVIDFDQFNDDNDVEQNEEVWLIQCPKSINLIEELQNQNIKIPGKTRVQNIETISEEFSNPKCLTLAYKTDNGYSVKMLSASGRILVREKIKEITNDVNENEDAVNMFTSIPLPNGLKQRHPLLGANFEDKLRLDEDILNNLRHAEEISNIEMRIKKEIKQEINDSEMNGTVNERKSKKKRKKKNDNVEQNEKVCKKKIKNEIPSQDEESDLSWIKNL